MHILGYPSGFLFDKTLDQGAGWEFAVFKVCSSFSWRVKFNQYLYVFLNLSTQWKQLAIIMQGNICCRLITLMGKHTRI